MPSEAFDRRRRAQEASGALAAQRVFLAVKERGALRRADLPAITGLGRKRVDRAVLRLVSDAMLRAEGDRLVIDVPAILERAAREGGLPDRDLMLLERQILAAEERLRDLRAEIDLLEQGRAVAAKGAAFLADQRRHDADDARSEPSPNDVAELIHSLLLLRAVEAL